MINQVQFPNNGRMLNSLSNTRIYQAVKAEACEAITAATCGARYLRMHKQQKNFNSAFKAVELGARQLYRRKGIFPLITGFAGFAAVPIPGAFATSLTLGCFLKKTFKNLGKSALKFVKNIK